jgi:hypothetical protein
LHGKNAVPFHPLSQITLRDAKYLIPQGRPVLYDGEDVAKVFYPGDI